MRNWTGLHSFWQDLRYAVRILRKNPGFATSAAVALALGIGANTAVFSLCEAVLLRPLPFPQPHLLMRVWESYGVRGAQGPESYPNFVDWRAWNRSFADMAAYNGWGAVMTGGGEPRHLNGLVASASLCQILRVQPVVGRLFRPEEDRPHANAGSDSVMIGEKLWLDQFGGRPDALGRTVLLDGSAFAIVGVIPRAIAARSGFDDIDFLTTIAPLAETAPGVARPDTEIRTISFLNVVGRLKPGVTMAQAQADMDRVAALLHTAYPKENPQTGVTLIDLQKVVTGDIQPVLLLLLASAGLVLLIACTDVAGLVLARATRRQREMTVRAAIGAGRWRIVRQLLVESLVLSLIGSAAGLWLATLLGRLLARVLHVDPAVLSLDSSVLAFAALLALFAAAVFSMAPAVHFFKSDLMERLRQSSLTTSEGRGQRRVHGALVVAQMALATVLLSSSGLLAVSLFRLQQIPLGFQPRHVLTFPVSLATMRYPQAQRARFFDQLTARLRSIPGVQAAGAGGQLPLQGSVSNTVLSQVAGVAVKPAGIAFASVTPQYFRTLGIPIRRGREFTDADSAGTMPVVIINEAAARRYFPSRDPIGQQVVPEMWNASGSTTQPRTIVGVAADIKLQGLTANSVPAIYWPVPQIPSDATLFVSVLASGDALRLAAPVRDQLRSLDPDLPLYDLYPLDHYVDNRLSQPRSTTLLIGMMAILALVLTAVGLYGVIAYSVARRTREIGIRMALGAGRGEILRGFLKSGLATSLLGVAIGLPAAIAASKLLRTLLFGLGSQKPLIYATGAVVLMLVALLASYMPARRATRIDPMDALRYE